MWVLNGAVLLNKNNVASLSLYDRPYAIKATLKYMSEVDQYKNIWVTRVGTEPH